MQPLNYVNTSGFAIVEVCEYLKPMQLCDVTFKRLTFSGVIFSKEI